TNSLACHKLLCTFARLECIHPLATLLVDGRQLTAGEFCAYRVAQLDEGVLLCVFGEGGGKIRPEIRLRLVLRHAPALVVSVGQRELREGVSLVSSLCVPAHGLGVVLGHSPAVVVDQAEVGLRGGIALVALKWTPKFGPG